MDLGPHEEALWVGKEEAWHHLLISWSVRDRARHLSCPLLLAEPEASEVGQLHGEAEVAPLLPGYRSSVEDAKLGLAEALP